MGREDVKKIRRKLRWFTCIVVVAAGLTSYFNTSIAEQGGINATGLGGAFATAFFFWIAILIFISIPFNVLAFIAVRSNRYSFEDFHKVSRVLTWFIVIVTLIFAISSYFAGFTAGSVKVVGIGASIYAVIFVPVILGIVVAVPTHVVAFIVFAIRGPRTSDDNILPGDTPRRKEKTERVKDQRSYEWTDKYQEALRQQRTNPTQYDISTLFVGQDQPDWKERASQFLKDADKYSLAASFFVVLTSGLVPEGEAREMAVRLGENCFKSASTFKAFRDIGKFVNHYILRKPIQKETQKDRQIEAFRKGLAMVYKIRRANQKQN